VIWLHAVSVGETRAAEALLNALRSRHPDCDLLITQMTANRPGSGAAALRGGVHVAWLPYDYPSAVGRFLRNFRPRLGVLMETENLVFTSWAECQRAGVPLLLANARLSAKSARGYAAVGPLIRIALGGLSAVAAQTTEDAERLRSSVRPPWRSPGTQVRRRSESRKRIARGAISARIRRSSGVARREHSRREEELLLDALKQNALGGCNSGHRPAAPTALRQGSAASCIPWSEVHQAQREHPLDADCGIVLGDSMGEMAAYYRALRPCFRRGKPACYGGQNLIEACAAGVPVLIGPYTYNFAAGGRERDRCRRGRCGSKVPKKYYKLARSILQDRIARAHGKRPESAFCVAHEGPPSVRSRSASGCSSDPERSVRTEQRFTSSTSASAERSRGGLELEAVDDRVIARLDRSRSVL